MKSRVQIHLFWLLAIVALSSLGGCATAPAVTNVSAPAPAVERYIIGPGDSLQIFVRDNPNLNAEIPVRPDGRISIPLVQTIVAAGKTPEQLADDLEQALAKYIKTPLVTVIVKNFVGAYSQQVRVVGQAATPKAVPYRSGMTLLDVMIEVGGLTKFAAGNSAKIVRRLPDGREESIPVRFDALMNGAIKDNVAMRPGDVLIIPQSLF